MIQEKDNSTDFEFYNLQIFLFKKRKPLIRITIAAIVVSTIVSFIITPKYKSSVILFPSTTSSISKSLLSENAGAKQDIMVFGEEEEAEQLVQILNSDELRGKIVKKYDLMNHYKIDTTGKYSKTNLFDKYEDNISFKRTEFMSVKIEVLDANPVMAANIANDIAAFLDTVKNRMQKERAIQGFKIVEREYNNFLAQIKAMEDSLKVIRGYGINDYESQSQVYGEQYAIALATQNRSAIKTLEEKLKVLSEFGGIYVSIRDNLEYERKQLRVIKTKYEEAKVDAEQNITHKFIVNRAYPAEKKSYPIRWLIVVVSTLSAFLMGVLLIIFVENFTNTKKEI